MLAAIFRLALFLESAIMPQSAAYFPDDLLGGNNTGRLDF
jgi:hypothetical protein